MSVSGELTTSSASLRTVRACSETKVSAYSWLWVRSEYGISTLPLVCVPEVTISFFSLLLELLLWHTTLSAKYSISYLLVRISDKKSFREIFWIEVLSFTWLYFDFPLVLFVLICSLSDVLMYRSNTNLTSSYCAAMLQIIWRKASAKSWHVFICSVLLTEFTTAESSIMITRCAYDSSVG